MNRCLRVRGHQHGVLDLLWVTPTKRLAIIELKATENPDLPIPRLPPSSVT